MAEPKMSVRGVRAGFVFVVALLAASSGFNIYSQHSTDEDLDVLIRDSLERERLIGLLRLDAEMLSNAADAHINAPTDEEREKADAALSVILAEIHNVTERYQRNLPIGELRALCDQLNENFQRLVKKIDVAVKYSNRREAERARRHLLDEVRPINFELDELANRVAKVNASETERTQVHLKAVRLNTTYLVAGTTAVALIASMFIAWSVTRVLNQRDATIRTQMDELARRNTELDSFASRVAHDLVAPLSPLKGYLTLARRQVTNDDVKALLVEAEESVARVSELVEALLRFCRSGKPSEGMEGDLSTAITTVLLEASQTAETAGVILHREIQPNLRVSCAPQLLQSIAHNIVSNALKYTTGCAHAEVNVRCRALDNDVVFEVVDNGPGMDESTQRQLFQPFFRATATRSLPGYGLGLATTKRLVEAHGGTIAVRTNLHRGTHVTVRLPRAAPPEQHVSTPTAPSATFNSQSVDA